MLEIPGIFPDTFVRANSGLYFLLGSLAVSELVILLKNLFDKSSTDQL